MFFRSTVLLRLVVLLGFLVALAGIVLATFDFEVADYFLEPEKTVPGYTSLAVLVLPGPQQHSSTDAPAGTYSATVRMRST